MSDDIPLTPNPRLIRRRRRAEIAVRLLSFCPRSRVAVINLDVNHMRPATHGAVFDVLLALTCRHVDRDDDFLPA